MLKIAQVALYPQLTFLECLQKSGCSKFHKKSVKGAVAVFGDDGSLWDLHRKVPDSWFHDEAVSQNVQWVSLESSAGLEVLRHTLAHTLAQAVKSCFPQIHCGLGPVIDEGFFYEFSTPPFLSLDDFDTLRQKIDSYIAQDLPLIRHEWSREQAMDFWKDDPLKHRILQDIPDSLTVYQQGDYWDLCRGPHLPSLGWIPPYFSLSKVAGSTWNKGPEKLQRIYGLAWAHRKDQQAYQRRIEEADKRDHRKLGQQMALFHWQEEAKGSEGGGDGPTTTTKALVVTDEAAPKGSGCPIHNPKLWLGVGVAALVLGALVIRRRMR